MKNIDIPNELKSLSSLKDGLVELPEPLLGAETVQIFLAREIHENRTHKGTEYRGYADFDYRYDSSFKGRISGF